VELPWTTRRANLLVEGVRLPRARGGILQIGPVKLEVTNQTVPCSRMDEAFGGLMKALYPEWRGGVTCAVLEGGDVALGDAVDVLVSPPEIVPRLP
jgi:MOSC domain-containing protein YiiM